MDSIYSQVEAWVRRELSCAAHNMEHVQRVYGLCIALAADYPEADMDVLKLAALLHDIARVREDQDDSGKTDHAVLGAEMAGEYLKSLNIPPPTVSKIQHCIATHRYRNQNEPQTIEAKILFDADKLDVIGAVGIARSFIITGQYGEPLFSDPPLDQYVAANLVGGTAAGRVKDISRHTANLEFELKLKHIPERLYTEKARKIGTERVAFMQRYFDRLRLEVMGNA